MDLSNLSTEPKLVEVKLDDKETVKQFGEPLVFFTYDRQPLSVYMTLSNATGNEQEKSVEILKTLVLDKDGKPVMADGRILPAKIMVKAMTKVMTLLGE
jgi:hypothetical protein